MIYTDNCCCCIDLRQGCIIISIVDVLIRGIDRFFVDRDSLLGFASVLISGTYLISCTILLVGCILTIRRLLLPYLFVALLHVLILIVECIYVVIVDDFYDYVVFDIFQAVLSLYFCLVVYSYYYSLRSN
ncbi:uncharacterized protein LOC117784270 isoform X2 [Drosophila innubila]|uniref:uncharacterized protein LOC117784270 isoform X2 n=1 Tax=Drosophila innubila TaxID=198719 RepID=UPI00148D65F6|nr:uncharacterized protein LOC117784270 isoform X2 [Drosophila innubila]